MVNGIASLHAACFWRIQAPNMKTTTGIVGLQTEVDPENWTVG